MFTEIKQAFSGAVGNCGSGQREMLTDWTNGQALVQEFLSAWQQAHGASNGTASALIGPDRLAVLLENAFSRTEHSLSRQDQQSENADLLQQYIHPSPGRPDSRVVAKSLDKSFKLCCLAPESRLQPVKIWQSPAEASTPEINLDFAIALSTLSKPLSAAYSYVTMIQEKTLKT